jgi:hypothetical protein
MRDPTNEMCQGRCSPWRLGFRLAGGDIAARWLIPAGLWRFLGHGDCTTGFGRSRRARMRGRRGRLRPGVGERRGWRQRERRCPSACPVYCELEQLEGIRGGA